MPLWLEVVVTISALVGPWVSGYFGMQRGMAVGLAVHEEKFRTLEAEVARIRARYHDRIAPMMTEHEVSLDMIKRQLGIP